VAEKVADVIPMLEASARRIGISADEELIEQRF
jgi:hypothetical protein